MSTNTNNSITNEMTKLQREQLILKDALTELPSDTAFVRQKNTINKIDTKINEAVALFNSADNIVKRQSNSDGISLGSNSSGTLLDSKNETLNVVNQQLRVANSSASRINNDYINNHRAIEINNFYNGHYLLYLNIFRYIIYTCTFLLIVALFKQFGALTIEISNILTVIIVIIAGYFIITAIIDLNYRNNVEITEYDFYTNPNTNDVPEYESSQDNDLTILQDLENKYNCLQNSSKSPNSSYNLL
jgi:hypothetical protein